MISIIVYLNLQSNAHETALSVNLYYSPIICPYIFSCDLCMMLIVFMTNMKPVTFIIA